MGHSRSLFFTYFVSFQTYQINVKNVHPIVPGVWIHNLSDISLVTQLHSYYIMHSLALMLFSRQQNLAPIQTRSITTGDVPNEFDR